MIPKRRKPRKMGVRESGRVNCPGHLAWLRGMVCLVANDDCDGRMEAHHVRRGADGGVGLKPGDETAVALCAWHHSQFHNVGHNTFERLHKVDLIKTAAELWQRSPHGIRYRRER